MCLPRHGNRAHRRLEARNERIHTGAWLEAFTAFEPSQRFTFEVTRPSGRPGSTLCADTRWWPVSTCRLNSSPAHKCGSSATVFRMQYRYEEIDGIRCVPTLTRSIHRQLRSKLSDLPRPRRETLRAPSPWHPRRACSPRRNTAPPPSHATAFTPTVPTSRRRAGAAETVALRSTDRLRQPPREKRGAAA